MIDDDSSLDAVGAWLAGLPRSFNIASHILAPSQERADTKTAVSDHNGAYTFGELRALTDQAAAALLEMGLEPEDRMVMVMADTVMFPIIFLGAIKAQIVPVPLNPLLSREDFSYIIADSRAKAVIAGEKDADTIRSALGDNPRVKFFEVDRGLDNSGIGERILRSGKLETPPATVADEVAFWLYSSGSTGRAKGVRHLHRNVLVTIECFARKVLGLGPEDKVFSAAKLFFAYGLGNGLTFPFSVGAQTSYLLDRPTPDSVIDWILRERPTVFCGVPTLFGSLLANRRAKELAQAGLRICTSAGEALPNEIGRRFEDLTGAPIIDGLGSTEMLHIFLSNRPGEIRYGSTGKPVPGYLAKLLEDDGSEIVEAGRIGELVVSGFSGAEGYWNQRDKSLRTFRGHWTHTGDKYLRDDDGFYYYAGRADDMMKVSGNWVSPFEVESALISHPAILEAAVVPGRDDAGLVKPKAYVVLRDGYTASPDLERELQHHVKGSLAPWKYPRWISFCDELPKTATGKIQRFKLRDSDGL